jgi:hypothetical protein
MKIKNKLINKINNILKKNSENVVFDISCGGKKLAGF